MTYNQEYYKKNKTKIKKQQKIWRDSNKKYRHEYNLKLQKELRYNWRVKLFDILGGPKCNCKGKDCWHKGKCKVKDKRAYQFDHIKGGGRKEFKKFANPSYMYKYYVKHPKEAKKTLQVLCVNCNWIKRFTNNECKVKETYK